MRRDSYETAIALGSSWDYFLAGTEGTVVYVPVMPAPDFFGSSVVNELDSFKAKADVIAANRVTKDIADVTDQILTRGLFGAD